MISRNIIHIRGISSIDSALNSYHLSFQATIAAKFAATNGTLCNCMLYDMCKEILLQINPATAFHHRFDMAFP